MTSKTEVVPAQQQAMMNLPSRGQAVALVGEASREMARVRGMMDYARENPRDEEKAFALVKKACERPTFAENASWEFPRGQQTISGGSVYLARAMARCWGHVIHGIRILEDDGDSIHGEAWAHDLERNVYSSKQYKVGKLIQRRVKDPKGNWIKRPGGGYVTEWIPPDERDLMELMNRVGEKHVRNAIFHVLPDDLRECALEWADGTLLRAAAAPPDGDAQKTEPGKATPAKINGVVVSFVKLGVTLDQIQKKIGNPVDDMTPEQYASLVKIGVALKEGRTTIDEAFGAGDAIEAQQPTEDDDPFSRPAPATLDEVVTREKSGPKTS